MKTVFIMITRGFLARNILRSSLLNLLKDAGVRVVILLPKIGPTDLLLDWKKEFESDMVTVEQVPNFNLGGFYRRFVAWVGLLTFTETTWTYTLMGNKKNKERSNFFAYIQKMIYVPLSRIHFLKTFVRWIELTFFRHHLYATYFDKYQPSLVFSTSIVSTPDILLMKEAQWRGIQTVSMSKGWDNIAKFFYRYVPTKFLVQNESMRTEAAKVQNIKEQKIIAVGFPQFDGYVHPKHLLSREEYCQKMGLDPNRKIIFFGSEGVWAPYDDSIADILSSFIEKNMLNESSSLIIRPHYSDAASNRFERFRGKKNICLDPFFTSSTFFLDNWDPHRDEMEMFTNLLFHSDVLVTSTSTLTLDFACFDKPIINVAFGILYKNGKDMSELFYKKDHYQAVLHTGAVDLVHSEKELQEKLNEAFAHREKKHMERQNLIQSLCYRVDGHSGKRIFEALVSLLP